MRYPWEKWFSWGAFSLRQGDDFDCTSHGMAFNVRQAARRLGFTVSVRTEDSGVVVVVKGKCKPRVKARSKAMERSL
jgi:hypothetical protein